MAKAAQWVRICPRCKSREVELRVIGDATGQEWVCLSCGFLSPLFPEVRASDARKLPSGQVNFTQSRMPVAGGIDRGVALALLLMILFWLLGSIF